MIHSLFGISSLTSGRSAWFSWIRRHADADTAEHSVTARPYTWPLPRTGDDSVRRHSTPKDAVSAETAPRSGSAASSTIAATFGATCAAQCHVVLCDAIARGHVVRVMTCTMRPLRAV